MTSSKASDACRRVAVHAADRAEAERLIAEAHAAGSVGIEEREGEDGIILSIYALAETMDAVRAAITAAVPGVRIERTEEVPGADWSELEPSVLLRGDRRLGARERHHASAAESAAFFVDQLDVHLGGRRRVDAPTEHGAAANLDDDVGDVRILHRHRRAART